MVNIAKNCQRIVLLSGTPINNSALDLFYLMDLLMPDYLGDLSFFKNNFHNKIKKSKVDFELTAGVDLSQIRDGSQENDENSRNDHDSALQAMLHLHKMMTPFLLRRMKSEVLQSLPPRTIINQITQLSSAQQKFYQQIQNDKHLSNFSKMRKLLQICQDLGWFLSESNEPEKRDVNYRNPKLESLLEILSTNPEGDHKYLIFFQNQSLIPRIQEKIIKNISKISENHIGIIDSSIDPKIRHQTCETFQDANSNLKILLLTTSSGSLGLNLTAADICIFYEHDWNPNKDIQAMDRCYRIGQNKSVFVYKLISDSAIERRIVEVQEQKKQLIEKVIHSREVLDDNVVTDVGDVFNEVLSSKQSEIVEESDSEVEFL